MIKILIVEDEKPAYEKLRNLILEFEGPEKIEVTGITRSITETLSWLESNESPDLIFMDIYLNGQISFDIFKETQILCPVIFATAYDEFVLSSLAFNGIDYLLKPISKANLFSALEKYCSLKNYFISDYSKLGEYGKHNNESPVTRILVKKGIHFHSVKTEDIAYFNSTHKITFLVDKNDVKYILDKTLTELEEILDKSYFFRLNRKYLVNINSISKFRSQGKGRLIIELIPPTSEEVVVSQENSSGFKLWIGK